MERPPNSLHAGLESQTTTAWPRCHRTRGTIPNTTLFPLRPETQQVTGGGSQRLTQHLPPTTQDPKTWQVTGGGSQRLNTQRPDPRTQDSCVYESMGPFLDT